MMKTDRWESWTTQEALAGAFFTVGFTVGFVALTSAVVLAPPWLWWVWGGASIFILLGWLIP